MPQRPKTGPAPPRAATLAAVASIPCLPIAAGACTSGPGEPDVPREVRAIFPAAGEG